jgi:hypothetical protein
MTQSRGTLYLDSWLFSASHLKSPDFAKALEDAMPLLPDGQYRGQFIGGSKVWALGVNDTTSILPAWRRTYAHIVQTGVGKPSSAPFRKLAPDMGAYANEATAEMPGWRNVFWGTNYAKLLAIKRKYDADGLFWVTPGVGAESWSAMPEGRLCRNPTTAGDGKSVADGGADERPPPTDNLNIADQTKLDETRGPLFPYVPGPDGVPRLSLARLSGKISK